MRRLALSCVIAALSLDVTPGHTPGRPAVAGDGAVVYLLDGEGNLSRHDRGSGRSETWGEVDAPPLPFRDIALANDGRTLYALGPSTSTSTTQLVGFDTHTGRRTGRWEARGEGRFLAVTSDGASAVVVGLRAPAAGKPAAKITEDDWMLTVVDLTTDRDPATVRLGLEPRAIALLEPPGDSARVLIAARDRVVSFGLDPPRVSWFYKSPGDNLDVAAVGSSSVVCALRGSSLAIIDPARWPRELGRVQLSEDDATSVVPLPQRGRAVALTGTGNVAVVLGDDGVGLTSVDLAAGRVIRTVTLEEAAGRIADRILGEAGLPEWLAIVGSDATRPTVTSWVLQSPAATDAGVAPPPPLPPAAPSVPAEPVSSESTPTQEESTATKPPPEGTAAAEPPSPTPPEEPGSQPAPDQKSEPAPPQPEPPEPQPEPQPSLSGRITGQRSAAHEALLYGPDNILKLRARAPIGEDGTFRFALPSPGSYRVVIAAAAGAYLFTSPQYRTVIVQEGSKGQDGIDFEVRGRLER